MGDHEEYRTPGQMIRAALETNGWTQRVLAIVLGVDEASINRLTSDKRPVDAHTALLLAETLGIDAERLLDLQKAFDLAQARLRVRADPARAKRAHLFGGLPVGEMIKRGWLDGVNDPRDVPAVEAALTTFFEASTIDDIEILPHAPKKTATSSPATPVQLAWIYRVRRIAQDMLVPRYSPSAVRNAISRLGALLFAAEEARNVPRILAEAGIRFVVVETLPGAKIDGVCLWLNDFSPVIGMTLRYDRLDNFWFVLRHELEHVVQMHGKTALMLDADLEGERAGGGPSVTDEERIANRAASDFCVPAKQLEGFIQRKQPVYAERDIIGFSNTIRVHRSLVAGQLQHRIGRYDRFRSLLVKVRSIVTPSALVDGWGNVVPLDA